MKMQVYLISQKKILSPFSSAAADLGLNNFSLRERLISQFENLNLNVVYYDFLDDIEFSSPSIILLDNIVVSNNFFENLIKIIEGKIVNYQICVDSSRYAVFNTNSIETAEDSNLEKYQSLPIYYYGLKQNNFSMHSFNAEHKSPSFENYEFENLLLKPKVIRELITSLPNRMHTLTGMRIHFLEYYAIEIKYWFNFLTASTLYCREHATQIINKSQVGKWLAFLLQQQWIRNILVRFSNRIGKNCRIHPSAVIEGCVIADDVEIGPFVCLRSCVVAARATIREHSSANFSYIGHRAYIMGTSIFNSYIGADTAIFTPMMYNSIIGDRSLVSGGSGFADFSVNAHCIKANIEGKDVLSDLHFLGGGVGNDCFIGADFIFAPARTIPHHTKLINHELIQQTPLKSGTYIRSGKDWLQIPESFL